MFPLCRGNKKSWTPFRMPSLPSVLMGPVHPFRSLAALTVPPSERRKHSLRVPLVLLTLLKVNNITGTATDTKTADSVVRCESALGGRVAPNNKYLDHERKPSKRDCKKTRVWVVTVHCGRELPCRVANRQESAGVRLLLCNASARLILRQDSRRTQRRGR